MSSDQIPPGGRRLRIGLAVAILFVLLFLALPRLETRLPVSIFPCGFHALTGLPCLFCGGTRAARAILHGNFPMAMYLNPLAFPVLLLIALTIVALLMEAATGHPLAPWEMLLRRMNRIAPVLILLGLAWWMIHIFAALRTPKQELVDFRNPIAVKARAWLARTNR